MFAGEQDLGKAPLPQQAAEKADLRMVIEEAFSTTGPNALRDAMFQVVDRIQALEKELGA